MINEKKSIISFPCFFQIEIKLSEDIRDDWIQHMAGEIHLADWQPQNIITWFIAIWLLLHVARFWSLLGSGVTAVAAKLIPESLPFVAKRNLKSCIQLTCFCPY